MCAFIRPPHFVPPFASYTIYCCFVFVDGLPLSHFSVFFCPTSASLLRPLRFLSRHTWNQFVVRDEAHAEGQSARDH